MEGQATTNGFVCMNMCTRDLYEHTHFTEASLCTLAKSRSLVNVAKRSSCVTETRQTKIEWTMASATVCHIAVVQASVYTGFMKISWYLEPFVTSVEWKLNHFGFS